MPITQTARMSKPAVGLKDGSANFSRVAAADRNFVITAQGGGVVQRAVAPL
ncbi:MAG: hypothetical protein AB8B94_02175 [Hyphomicrobiales bacterium]